MLKDLHEKDFAQLKSSQKQTEPKLTHVKILNIDKEIAKNLAMYGNPLGLFRKNGKNGNKKIQPGKNNKTWIEK